MIEVLAPATSEAGFLDLARAQELLPGAKEDLLMRLGRDASQAIEDHMGRPLLRQRYRETLGSSGGVAHLNLSRYPVEGEGLEVSRGGEPLPVVLQDPEAGILFLDRGWPSTNRLSGSLVDLPVMDSEAQPYEATYWAGYLLEAGESQPQARELPSCYRRAALKTVLAWVRGDQRDPEVQAKGQGSEKITYFSRRGRRSDLPEEAVALLPVAEL